MSNISVELIQQWCRGDPQAAAEICRRYAPRLIEVVQRRLSARFNRRFDAEDVAQSALAEFLTRPSEHRDAVLRSGSLWALLFQITLHKLQNRIRLHLAGKRSVEREQGYEDERGQATLGALADGREPPPETVAELNEVLDAVLERLRRENDRLIFAHRLEGATFEEIAGLLDMSERGVRKALAERIQPVLEAYLTEGAPP